MPSEVFFYQPNEEQVNSWEFQTSYDLTNWYWVDVEPTVENCAGCYTATVSDSRDYPYYRARSVNPDGVFSGWSNTSSLPEADFISLLLFGAFSLSLASRLKARIKA